MSYNSSRPEEGMGLSASRQILLLNSELMRLRTRLSQGIQRTVFILYTWALFLPLSSRPPWLLGKSRAHKANEHQCLSLMTFSVAYGQFRMSSRMRGTAVVHPYAHAFALVFTSASCCQPTGSTSFFNLALEPTRMPGKSGVWKSLRRLGIKSITFRDKNHSTKSARTTG